MVRSPPDGARRRTHPRQRRYLLAVGVAVAVLWTGGASAGPAPPPAAFPGATGFGAGSVGGRGGDVAVVSNLDDDGPGSLREAIDAAVGPRTIVFEVGGTIDLRSPLRIQSDRLTIAGQTAPGGITLRGYPTEIVGMEHVVLRYLRFRTGDINAAAVPGKPGRGNADLVGDAGDALSILASEHVIVDHVSASWGMDETLSVTKSADVTVQHSIISESLNDSFHTEGVHGYGSLVRGTGQRGYSFVGNLWAHHQRRMPAIGGQQDPPSPGQPGEGLDIDLVNNVIYDWLLMPTHTLNQPYQLRVHLEGNTYVRGPGAAGCPCVVFNLEATADELLVHRSANAFDDDGDATDDPRPVTAGDFAGPVTFASGRFPFDRPLAPAAPPDCAAEGVVATAGASLHRDAVDQRIAADVAGRTGSIIDSQENVGGWPATPPAGPAPVDIDRDGMADEWELAHGLDPTDAGDRNGRTLDAPYTDLEVYLASLVGPGWDPGECPVAPTTTTTPVTSIPVAAPAPTVTVPGRYAG